MINLKNVSKVYGDGETTISLSDLEFKRGQAYCILGPSGCGKSTLLNMLAGVAKPSEGTIEVKVEGGLGSGYSDFAPTTLFLNSLNQKELDRYRATFTGYISQDFRLLEEFTVMDNLKIASKVGEHLNSPDDVLSWVGLEHKHKTRIKNLSGGEKQRVSIARALLKNPELMLCDEPTASLNFSLASQIMQLLVDTHKRTANTLIVVTHDQRMVEYFDHTYHFGDVISFGGTK